MDKEKLIEEMAKDIHNAKKLSDYHCYEDEYTDCKKCKLLKYAENKLCQDAYEACSLIEDGWYKITKGAVVLTREEYIELKQRPEKVHNEMDKRMKEELAIEKRMGEKKAEQARKEAVEKVLDIIRSLQLDSEFPTPEDWANFFKSLDLIRRIKDAFEEE